MFLVKAKIIVCASRLGSSFRRYASRFLAKAKIILCASRPRSSFRHFVSRFLVKAKIIVCASRLGSSFRRYASMFLVQKSKEQFFVPELGALFLVQKSDENSSLFRHFVSRFFVRAELIKDADSFRILSEVNDVSTSYKDLHVWQLSMDYVMVIYRLTRDFPEYEKYGLGSQLQRSAVSIPSNIAEGSGRQHRKEFIQFLYLARGSLLESLIQLAIANRLGYINNSCLESIEAVGTKIDMMINKLISSLKKPGL